jgi:predicted DCC family thiol-disulfide oxidoreductase YuxK
MARLAQPGPVPREVIFYDGTCGLCHAMVRFAARHDRAAWFAYAPLGGETFRATTQQSAACPANSVVVQTSAGELLARSAAVLHVLRRLGGGWRALAAVLAVIPRPLLDGGYRAVARVRRTLLAAPAGECPVVPPPLRSRFLP